MNKAKPSTLTLSLFHFFTSPTGDFTLSLREATAMSLTPEQLAKIRNKEITTPDALKRDPLTNYREGWFFVTLNTRDGVPVLSTCEGSPSIADDLPNAPHCRYTPLGQGVLEAWKRNEEIYDNIIVDMCEAMPEHFHGLIYLKPGNKRHLGQIIKGFMIGCSHAYWDTLGIPWRDMIYTKGVRTPQYEDRDHTRSYRGPALFVCGYNDVEPLTPEDVDIKRAYIRDQARKRIIQGDRHSCFVKHRHQYSHNWTIQRIAQAIAADPFFRANPDKCQQAQADVTARLSIAPQGHTRAGLPTLSYIGSQALLGISKLPDGTVARKLPLICHRRDAWQFDRQKAAILQAARNGAIPVSAFISPKERDIREQLMTELLPFIEITDNGFSDRYKPSGKAFYAMAENRLVQISPWSYLYQKDATVTREMCLTMNELARIITGEQDDWWK